MSRLSLRARRALRDLPVAVIHAPKGSVLILEAADPAHLDGLLPVVTELANRTGLFVLATVRGDETVQILRPGDRAPVPFDGFTTYPPFSSDRPKAPEDRPTAPNPARPVRY